MNYRRLLRHHREGSKNTFTVGNGHHPGATSGHGNSRETGGSGGCLAPAGGRAPGKPGNRPSSAGAAGQGPLHLIHEGGLVVLCPDAGAPPRPTRHKAKTPARRNPPSQPRPRGQIGMTSSFPPTATAARAVSHSPNQMNCGRPVSPSSLRPLTRCAAGGRGEPGRKETRRHPSRSPQFTGIGDRLAARGCPQLPVERHRLRLDGVR